MRSKHSQKTLLRIRSIQHSAQCNKRVTHAVPNTRNSDEPHPKVLACVQQLLLQQSASQATMCDQLSAAGELPAHTTGCWLLSAGAKTQLCLLQLLLSSLCCPSTAVCMHHSSYCCVVEHHHSCYCSCSTAACYIASITQASRYAVVGSSCCCSELALLNQALNAQQHKANGQTLHTSSESISIM